MTKVYNRKTKQTEEVHHFGGSKLNTIYKSKILTRITTSKFISKLYGLYNSSSLSKRKINNFIKDNNIDMSLYEEENYKSFNDFFIRKHKKINISSTGLISPCDGKLLVYKIKDNLEVNIKGITYNIKELFNDDLNYFKDGYMLVYRLSLDNYHRFHYIDDGKRINRIKVKGRLHTVSNSSSKYKIYKENEREYSILDCKNIGRIIYMEVGALLVGKIINYDLDTFKRGEEKGYFMPGGSTIVILVNNVKIASDIIKYSNKNIETIVTTGEKVGDILC
jgi:phosphatidylserine decarboxylase